MNYNSNKHLGEISKNKYGETFQIIKYLNCKDIIIQFFNDAHYTKHTNYFYFKEGRVASPYAKRTYGVGYLGEGKYNFTDKNNLDFKGHAKKTKCFEFWQGMMYRCYGKNFQRRSAYLDCSVCEEWHNYQNFAKWFDDNYYSIDNEQMVLDKDILYKGNCVYSPISCCIVPATINKIFVKREKAKEFEMPIGIMKIEYKTKPTEYRARVKKYNKYCELGNYNTIKEAFSAYKIAKEKYIKEVADLYKNKIPKKIYDAMYNYQVEITD